MQPSEEQKAPEPAVRAFGVGKRFGRQWALAHFDLEVAPGEIVLLAGPNGSGKTTFLRVASGLARRTRGDLHIFGLDPERERLACRANFSLVSHQSYLYDRLTARETLRLWGRLLARDLADEELSRWLTEVELDHSGDKQVGGFSAGMRKRLTLLRTRIEAPRLVLLDEPLAALDRSGKRLVETWIDGFRSSGITVLIASHAIERMSRICDRAVLMEQGQIRWTGPADQLLERLEESA